MMTNQTEILLLTRGQTYHISCIPITNFSGKVKYLVVSVVR